MVAAIVAREIAVSGLRLAAIERGVVMGARDLGKLKTWAQTVAATLAGLQAAGAWDADVAWWALLVATLLTWISGLDYARVAPRVLRGERRSLVAAWPASATTDRARSPRRGPRATTRSAGALSRPELKPARSAAARAAAAMSPSGVGLQHEVHPLSGYASGSSRAAVALNDATTTRPRGARAARRTRC